MSNHPCYHVSDMPRSYVALVGHLGGMDGRTTVAGTEPGMLEGRKYPDCEPICLEILVNVVLIELACFPATPEQSLAGHQGYQSYQGYCGVRAVVTSVERSRLLSPQGYLRYFGQAWKSWRET